MIVIGADTHKRTHMLAGVDADTGQVLSGRQIAADDGGHLQAVRWARNLSSERVWAIEASLGQLRLKLGTQLQQVPAQPVLDPGALAHQVIAVV